eukprot:COSAG02_NODE_53335_length_302_cov_1.014778_1_plen_62_part_10
MMWRSVVQPSRRAIPQPLESGEVPSVRTPNVSVSSNTVLVTVAARSVSKRATEPLGVLVTQP